MKTDEEPTTDDASINASKAGMCRAILAYMIETDQDVCRSEKAEAGSNSEEPRSCLGEQ
jgi:hypothetical protein